MNYCPVCNGTALKGLICCTCGFDESRNYESHPTAAPAGNAKSITVLRSEWIEAQKISYLKQLRLELKTHYYTYDDETKELSLDHSEPVTLMTGDRLRENEVVWSDMEFLRIEGMPVLDVFLTVYNKSGNRTYCLKVNTPSSRCADGKWKLGVRLGTTADMGAELIVSSADGKQQESSDTFALKF